MRRICEKCGGRFDGHLLCPSCGCQLRVEPDLLLAIAGPSHDSWQIAEPTFLHRLTIGGVLVFVLFQSLLHIGTGLGQWPTSDASLPTDLIVATLSISMLFAGVISGLGNHRAEIIGCLLGSMTSGVLLTAEHWRHNNVPEAWWYGLPLMQGLVGIVAGLGGRLLCQPAPRFSVPKKPDTQLVLTPPIQQVPIRWVNVLLGVVGANLVVVYAEPIRQSLGSVLGSGGSSYHSGTFVIWEITTIGTLLAGVLAGAGSRGGIRHGAIAGLFATAGLMAAAYKTGITKLPTADFWIDFLELSENYTRLYVVIALMVLITMTVGGWLGANLFLPRKTRH